LLPRAVEGWQLVLNVARTGGAAGQGTPDSRLSRNLMADPLLVHSTRWRRARGSVILSFVVVNRADQTPELTGIPIVRTQLERGGPTSAPASIGYAQVLEHGFGTSGVARC
jgi:hypothetical protein